MIHTFECECGSTKDVEIPISEPTPYRAYCRECGDKMRKVWKAPQLILRGDPDHVPEHARVTQATSFGHSKAAGARKEKAYFSEIQRRRKQWRESGNKKGDWRPDIAPPAELYHGKIRETGDKHYWDDPANRKRHKNCKVSD